MGVKMVEGISYERGNTYFVNPLDLDINWAENGRRQKTREELEKTITPAFLESLIAEQIHPSKVRKVNGKLKLVAGYRRALGIVLINERGLATPPRTLRVELDAGNDSDAFLTNLRENKDNRTATALDNADNIERLHKLYGWKDKAIAEFYGKTSAWVSKTRKLLELPEKFQTLIDNGTLTASQAEVLVDATEEWREQVFAEIQASGMCKLSAADLKRKAVDEGASKGDASLKVKHMREFWEALADPAEEEEVPAEVSEFAKVTLNWMSGKRNMGNNKYYTEILDRLKATKKGGR